MLQDVWADTGSPCVSDLVAVGPGAAQHVPGAHMYIALAGDMLLLGRKEK